MRYISRGAAGLLILLIVMYRRLVSPFLPIACRFYPTCSEYALVSIRTHGPIYGAFLALRRLGRCHPYHQGGLDPVPQPRSDHQAPREF